MTIPGGDPSAKPFTETNKPPTAVAHDILCAIIDTTDPEGRQASGLPLPQPTGTWYVSLERIEPEDDEPEQSVRVTLSQTVDAAESSTIEEYLLYPTRILGAYGELDAGEVDELIEDLKPVLTASSPAYKYSLELIEDRRQAMNRCVGPLVSALTFEQGDTRMAEETTTALRSLRDALERDRLAGGWFRVRHDFKTVYDATRGLGYIIGIGNTARNVETDSPFMQLSETQRRALLHNTYNESIAGVFSVAHNSQAYIDSQILIPAYLATKYDCRTRDDLLAVCNQVTLHEILDIMRDNLGDELNRLTFAPNETFANATPDESVGPLQQDRDLYYPNSALVRPIHDLISRNAPETPPHSQHPHYFSVFNLYIKTKDGRIIVNPEYFVSAQIGVKLESKYRTQVDGLTPTVGCPGGKRSYKIHGSDVTAEQLRAFEASPHIMVRLGKTGITLDLKASAVEYLHKIQTRHLALLLAVT